ncbi:hypothetical protein LAD80_000083 [Proteus mirabilis]|uniref:Uncharacterized protein n=1 Tax=Proteus mirabilis TaxID=584 RepID=A0ABD5LY13_PROMI|nr:hypothetical protein [Proteus mirabilis]EKV1609104.1 hypothetical protein [Proteus mirabilis]MBO8919133.1 hypothetical protein [Proteus mirabilis]MBQ0617042.1 hypothetical protein [Proteus mirabilis]MCJ2217952.1 hypothetical protein [Proteus mirabilis]HBC6251434.1 hypothetical protein [Proteus mirabilis]
MSIDYEPKLIVGADMDKVTINEEEIDDLLNEDYTRHGSYFSGRFSFIGKEVRAEEIIDPNFMLKYLSIKNEVAKELGVTPVDITLRNGVLIM